MIEYFALYHDYYNVYLVNFTSNEHRMNIGYISAGHRMGSGWAAAEQQLSIGCPTAENRMAVLMKNGGFPSDSQRLSSRCSTAAHPLPIRCPSAIHPIFNNMYEFIFAKFSGSSQRQYISKGDYPAR